MSLIFVMRALPKLVHCFCVLYRQFGGFALSHDDVETQYDELKRDLRGEDFDSDIFYSVGYNSPFTVEGRRNEIWIEV